MSDKKNIAVYFLANSVNAAIPFLLLPILTRYLSPLQYGQVAIFIALVSALGAFIGLNSVGASSRVYFDDLTFVEKLRYNNSCVLIFIISSLLVCLILFYFGLMIEEKIDVPIEYVYFSLFVSMCNYIFQFRLVSFQVRKEAIYFGMFQISNSSINCFLSLIFVVSFGLGEFGRILGISLSMLFMAIFSLSSLFKNKIWDFRVGLNASDIKGALAFGIPLVTHVFGGFLLASADRFVITNYFNASSAGIYMVAVQISMIFAIVFDALNRAFMPWLFERLSDSSKESHHLIVRMTYSGFLLSVLIAILASYFIPYILPYLLGEEFIIPSGILVWLFFAQVFGGMYLAVTNYIFYSKQTKKLAYVTIISGVINILLLVILVPRFDLQGAAIAFFLSKLLQFLLTWYTANSCFKMPWFKPFDS
ncbi:oligosaccharide flippase family protein [Vibrio cyclitrophicus]